MKESPHLFDTKIEENLAELDRQRQEEKARQEAPAESELKGKEKSDALALRARMGDVRAAERTRAVVDIMYLMVCNQFIKLNVPLIPAMKDAKDVNFGMADMESLTNAIYSKDSLQLVREHLLGMLGQLGSNSMFMGAQVMQMALIQASQVYVMSAFFGYYLRRIDSRWQLEKLVGTFGSEKADGSDGSEVVADEKSISTLKEYIESFGVQNMQDIISSQEGHATMERQVIALFGDIRALQQKVQVAIGEVSNEKEAEEKFREVIQNGEVESIRITATDLSRMVLEAVAFGSLLYDKESQVGTMYDLTVYKPTEGLALGPGGP